MALADVERVIQHGKRVADARSMRGNIRIRCKEWDVAITDFNEAIRLKPDDETSWCNRAFCWLELDDFARAADDARQALRLNPQSTFAAELLRQAEDATAGKHQRTARQLRRFLPQQLATIARIFLPYTFLPYMFLPRKGLAKRCRAKI